VILSFWQHVGFRHVVKMTTEQMQILFFVFNILGIKRIRS